MISRNARKTGDGNPAFRRNQFEMKRTENITFTNKTRSKHFVTTTRVIYGVQCIIMYTKSLSFATMLEQEGSGTSRCVYRRNYYLSRCK